VLRGRAHLYFAAVDGGIGGLGLEPAAAANSFWQGQKLSSIMWL